MIIAPRNKISKAERRHSRYRAHTSALLWKNNGQGAMDYTALATKAILLIIQFYYVALVSLSGYQINFAVLPYKYYN